MNLKSYLNKHRMTVKEFSIISGISPRSLSRYLAGTSVPHVATARKIEKASKSEIKFEDIRGIEKE